MPPRFDAACPECGSLERHRLFVLADRAHKLVRASSDVLHIAPELIIGKYVRARCGRYTTLDLFRDDADVKEPIEKTSLASESFDHIVCSHVLEHVDDRRALAEMFRLLRPQGSLLAMVPIIEGWDATYERPEITSEADCELHFGQGDHIRYYGRDFRDRIRSAGFNMTEFTSEGPEVVTHGLLPGEKLFVATKP
jgi:SAM-dependent methyltransferase